MNKCLFLDRDGTINTYLDGGACKIEQVTLIKGVQKLIAKFIDAGWKIIVITNQGEAVATGRCTEEEVVAIHEYLRSLLLPHGADLHALYSCPHMQNAPIKKYAIACNCRKPAPGLLLNAIKDFDADLKYSLFIGDNYTDMLCAQNAGVRFYPIDFKHVICTRHGFRTLIEEYDDKLIEDIFAYANNP